MKKAQIIIDIEQQAAMTADGFSGNLLTLLEREKILREKEELKNDYAIYASEYNDVANDIRNVIIYTKNKNDT